MKTRTVLISLHEIIDTDGEGFLDTLEELFFAEDDEEHRGILSDIKYKAVRVEGDFIAIEVTADVENIYCDIPECGRCADLYSDHIAGNPDVEHIYCAVCRECMTCNLRPCREGSIHVQEDR